MGNIDIFAASKNGQNFTYISICIASGDPALIFLSQVLETYSLIYFSSFYQ